MQAPSGGPPLGLGGQQQQQRGSTSGSWLSGMIGRGRSATERVNFPLAFVIILSLALFGISVFVVYRFLVTNLKTTTLVPDPVYLWDSTPATISSTKLPALNGREYGVAFWMYSTGVSNQNDSHQEFITFKGSGTGGSAISVVQDRLKNRIYLVILTSAANPVTGGQTANSIVNDYLGNNQVTGNHVIIPVDYIPLQRWINICLVVDQDVATVYMDGDIYNVHVTSQQVGGSAVSRSMFADPTGGDVVFNNSGTAKVRSYISKLQFFNYALSVYHAKSIYSAGPSSSGPLAWLGLANYKLQWPIVEAA